jgi:homocysteine S-methyltransferase
LVDFHGERIEILAEADPDLLAVETIPDADEAAAIAEVLVDYPDLPAWMTFSCGDERTTWAGQPISEAVRAAVCAPSVTAIGVNCVAPHLVTGLLGRIAGATDLPTGMPLVAYPNAGRVWLPDTETWSDSAAGGGRVESASGTQGWPVTGWVFAGARLIGGCCCVEPEAVSALAEHLA